MCVCVCVCVCGCVCVCAKERERERERERQTDRQTDTDTERQKECVCVDVCVRQEDLKNLFWRSLVVNLECVAKDRKVSHLSELRNKGETKLANYDYAGALNEMFYLFPSKSDIGRCLIWLDFESPLY